MKNSLSFLLNSAEYFLIIAVLIYWYSSSLQNPIAIGMLAVLIFQIIFKNYVIGILIPCMLILISMYMILALFAEVNEFEIFNSDAQRLLIIGLAYFPGTILISFLMMFNYLSRIIAKKEEIAINKA